jgi:hypothetical protein
MAGFRINNKTYEIPDDITLDEMCDAEEVFNKNFGERTTVTTKMLIWIAVRRQGDQLEPEEIGGLKASAFDVEGDAVPPALAPASRNDSSGGSSEPSMDTRNDPRDSGNQNSDIGLDSARETFFTSLRGS